MLHLRTVFAVLALISWSNFESAIGCPEIDVAPCSCEDDVLTCSKVYQQDKLIDVLIKVSKYDLFEVILENVIFNSLDPSVYQNLRVESLVFKDVTLNDLVSPHKKTIYNNRLIDWSIKSSKMIHNWDWSVLNGFPELFQLRILESKFHYISSNAFSTDTLRSLQIRNSGLQWIEDYAFSKMKSLHSLDLQGNQLSNITKEIIANDKLILLSLKKNWISHLPEDVFRYVPSLQQLDLADNFIQVFDFCALFAERPLLYLLLKGNPLHCSSCHVEWKFCYLKYIRDYDSLECTSPKNLEGQKLKDLSEKQVECPLKEDRCEHFCGANHSLPLPNLL